jgi:hypothetical protein
MRRGAVLVVILALTIVGFPTTAHARNERLSCANGFDPFPIPQTEAEVRAFPRINAGLNADPPLYTVDELIALAAAVDENDDGIFCLKAVSNLRGNSVKKWAYFYEAADNTTAAS